MILQPLEIGDELCFLTREEVAYVDVLLHTRSVKGTQVARELWLTWMSGVARIDSQKRRLAAGRAMGFADQASNDRNEQAAEEDRREVLYACAMHIFDMRGIERAAGKIPPRLTCVMCKGSMLTIEACTYARGFKAAGGDPNTVIEGFEP